MEAANLAAVQFERLVAAADAESPDTASDVFYLEPWHPTGGAGQSVEHTVTRDGVAYTIYGYIVNKGKSGKQKTTGTRCCVLGCDRDLRVDSNLIVCQIEGKSLAMCAQHATFYGHGSANSEGSMDHPFEIQWAPRDGKRKANDAGGGRAKP